MNAQPRRQKRAQGQQEDADDRMADCGHPGEWESRRERARARDLHGVEEPWSPNAGHDLEGSCSAAGPHGAAALHRGRAGIPPRSEGRRCVAGGPGRRRLRPR